jgi:rhodanese-related sulfurtransferase
MVRTYIQNWLSESSKTILIISSSYLKEEIVEDWNNQSDKYQIVSVRKSDHYKKAGHIANAINIYWVDMMRDECLNRLEPDKTLVHYCYYGHGSMITSTILNLLDYRCYSLDFGMMDWNLDALKKQPWDQTSDYEVEITVNKSRKTYPVPKIESNYTDAKSIVEEMAEKYLAIEGSPVIRSSDVKTIIDNWDNRKAEFQIVDVRPKIKYKRGHAPYSINIPWVKIADIESVTKIDPQRTVIVCSENGQTGQLVTTVLNLLGYQAVNMLFGMMDWNKEFVDSHNQWDGVASYPVEN